MPVLRRADPRDCANSPRTYSTMTPVSSVPPAYSSRDAAAICVRLTSARPKWLMTRRSASAPNPEDSLVMGITAENLAKLYNISREKQDAFSFRSQQKAIRAIKTGYFKEEIIPITVPQKKGQIIFDTDEHPRETTMEKLAALPPAFLKDGT